MTWYYANAGRQVIPIQETELEALVQAGTITPDTLIWHEGLTEWQPYGQKVGLVGAQTAPATAAALTFIASPITDGGVPCLQCRQQYALDDVLRFGDVEICANCKPIYFQRLKEGARLPGSLVYAGFGVRFLARFVDLVILYAINFAIGMGSGLLLTRGMTAAQILPLQLAVALFQLISNTTYETWFLGKFGATPGKMLCRLKVVTADGGRISYMRACGRHFAEHLSGIIVGVGYFMAAFDEEHRALHDRICNTRVISTRQTIITLGLNTGH